MASAGGWRRKISAYRTVCKTSIYPSLVPRPKQPQRRSLAVYCKRSSLGLFGSGNEAISILTPKSKSASPQKLSSLSRMVREIRWRRSGPLHSGKYMVVLCSARNTYGNSVWAWYNGIEWKCSQGINWGFASPASSNSHQGAICEEYCSLMPSGSTTFIIGTFK